MNNIKLVVAGLLIALLFYSCSESLPEFEDISRQKYLLIDQNEDSKNFPAFVKGKTVVIGYIFTNCPDICPLTTNNMRLIQEKLRAEKIKNVEFVSISFDPAFDTPEVLRKFANVRNLDLSNWTFLTGDKPVIDSLMKKVGVLAVPGDSTLLPSGEKIVYYVHTDRIQLIDTRGVIRKNYPGSTINIDEIVEDVKSITE